MASPGAAVQEANRWIASVDALFRRTGQGSGPAESPAPAAAPYKQGVQYQVVLPAQPVSTRPGQIDRKPISWDVHLGLRAAPRDPADHVLRCAVSTDDAGVIQGYVVYRVETSWEHRLPNCKLEILELMSLTADAYLGLWRYCCEVDLVSRVNAGLRCVDEPLPWLLHNPRAALVNSRRADFLWLRPLDVPATLAARVRVLATSRSNKNDPNDALSIAIAARHAPRITTVQPADHAVVLRLLVKRHHDLGRLRNRTACRLHALLCELAAGGIVGEITPNKAQRLLDALEPQTPVEQVRHQLACDADLGL